MKNPTIRNAVLLFIFVLVLFILFVGVVLLVKSKIPGAIVEEKDVTFEGETNQVSITRAISVTSDFGRNIEEDNAGAFGYVTFDIVNHSSKDRNYQIYLTMQDTERKAIHTDYVVLYLTDEKDQALGDYKKDTLPTYYHLRYIDDKPDSRILYKGTLKGNKTEHFKLRVWVSENYVVQDPGEEFAFKIDARAV